MRKALPVIAEDARPSSSAYNMNIMVARNHGCRCSTAWPAGKPRPARTWPSCWASIAIPSATGWRSMPAGGLEALLDLYVPRGQALVAPPGRAGRAGAGPPAAGWFCLLRSPAPVGQADPSPGRQLSHPLHDRPHPLQRQAQGAAAQSHKKTLRPFGTFRRPVRSSCSASSRRRIPARCACSARTKVVCGLLTVRRRRLTACGVQPVGVGPARLRMVLCLWRRGPHHG